SARGGTFIAATCARAAASNVGLTGAAVWGAAAAGAATSVSPSKRTSAPARGLAHAVRLIDFLLPGAGLGPTPSHASCIGSQGRVAQRNEYPYNSADSVPVIDRNLTRSNRWSCCWRVLYPFGMMASSVWIVAVDGPTDVGLASRQCGARGRWWPAAASCSWAWSFAFSPPR